MTSPQSTAAPHKPRSSRSVPDMLRSLTVVAAIVLVVVVVNYRAPEDPVKQIDPVPVAREVATVAPFEVLLPSHAGWRATAARWEPTEESGVANVWYAGGVYGSGGPFASLSQSEAATQPFLAEQTGEGAPAGTWQTTGSSWQRFETAAGQRSLVLTIGGATTIVTGTGNWAEVEQFAASLQPVVGNGQ